MLSDKIDAEIMDSCGPNLKIISTFSTGFDHIDVSEATKRNVYVTFTGDILAEATADLTFSLILSLARNVFAADSLVREKKWKVGWMPDLLLGHDLSGATLGIIGLGRIGMAVARRANAFSMKILYNSRNRKPEAELSTGAKFASLDELLAKSDFVTLHANLDRDLPLLKEGRVATNSRHPSHLIDASKLKIMKRTAYLINTARGQLIDQRALTKALKENWIAGAGLDVFETEPLQASSPLRKIRNVILLPHIGSATVETRDKMAQVSVGSIDRVLEGMKPESAYTVNKELLARS